MTATEELRNACHVVGSHLKCDRCNKRICSNIHREGYTPKYPYCPWCGAPVTVDAQMVESRKQ